MIINFFTLLSLRGKGGPKRCFKIGSSVILNEVKNLTLT